MKKYILVVMLVSVCIATHAMEDMGDKKELIEYVKQLDYPSFAAKINQMEFGILPKQDILDIEFKCIEGFEKSIQTTVESQQSLLNPFQYNVGNEFKYLGDKKKKTNTERVQYLGDILLREKLTSACFDTIIQYHCFNSVLYILNALKLYQQNIKCTPETMQNIQDDLFLESQKTITDFNFLATKEQTEENKLIEQIRASREKIADKFKANNTPSFQKLIGLLQKLEG